MLPTSGREQMPVPPSGIRLSMVAGVAGPRFLFLFEPVNPVFHRMRSIEFARSLPRRCLFFSSLLNGATWEVGTRVLGFCVMTLFGL